MSRKISWTNFTTTALATIAVGDRYDDPRMRGIRGPKPDLHVWMGLFLDEELDSRAQYEDECEIGEPSYENIHLAMRDCVRRLPVLTLLRNILQYMENLPRTTKGQDLLRFCATYGLSRAIRNVMEAKNMVRQRTRMVAI